MFEHTEYNDALVRRHREYCQKVKNAIDEREKEHYMKLAKETQEEMFLLEFDDRNFKRFNEI